jgi:hypothetical protein
MGSALTSMALLVMFINRMSGSIGLLATWSAKVVVRCQYERTPLEGEIAGLRGEDERRPASVCSLNDGGTPPAQLRSLASEPSTWLTPCAAPVAFTCWDD